jgi:TPR repeat
MRNVHKALITIFLFAFSTHCFAQNKQYVTQLIDRGVALNDSGKYAEAIAKYNEALKLDSNNQRADYELAYTFFSSDHEKDAIPYLEKVVKLNPNSAGAFDMLGSIYDDEKKGDKAVEYYLQGIKVDPDYQRLHFNLAIAYFRQGKNAEAEACAIDAIKLDPKHASSQRIYALATYAQGKRGESLLGWCSFLLLEPQTQRSSEAYHYVKKIINYGINKTAETKITLSINPKDTASADLLMPMAVLSATLDKKNLTPVDSLSLQLTSLFAISESFGPKTKDTFYQSFYADYFKNLTAAGNAPAFARFISISAYPDDNLQWFKDNDAKLKALDLWIRTTERKF